MLAVINFNSCSTQLRLPWSWGLRDFRQSILHPRQPVPLRNSYHWMIKLTSRWRQRETSKLFEALSIVKKVLTCSSSLFLVSTFEELTWLEYNFTNDELIRPKWDMYFLRLAEVVATRSNCMKRAVGAVIVNDLRIVSTGYNGTPFGSLNCN